MTRFFCPGRTELAGNHTDHQKGRVMAAAVDRGITAEAELNGENLIRVFSEGFEPVTVDLGRLWPEESDVGTSASLVRGMARGLDISGSVSSPTFTLVNEYPGDPVLFHFDMYRLKDSSELYGIGWEDYLDRNGICVVEWSERVADAIPSDAVTLRFERLGENDRRIEIEGML